MITKLFEIRDSATFIPVVAIKCVPTVIPGQYLQPVADAERYLLRRAGFNFADPCVILCRLECSGIDRNATYDPYSWGNQSRTYQVAHLYIIDHFDDLANGQVIDVEFILGETKAPKVSEREDDFSQRITKV